MASDILEGTTPGPWHADNINSWNVWAADCKVAKTFDVGQAEQYREPPEAERVANAKLIALAPTLAAENARLRASWQEVRELVSDAIDGGSIGALTALDAIDDIANSTLSQGEAA